MENNSIIKVPKIFYDAEGKFIIPEADIKLIQRQLHTIDEIGDNLAYTTTYVTYKLSNVTVDSGIHLSNYAKQISNFRYDQVNKIVSKHDVYHSFLRGRNGVSWLMPKSSISILAHQSYLSHIEMYVNFDEDDVNSLWYILEFYFDLISVDEKLKASDKAKKLSK